MTRQIQQPRAADRWRRAGLLGGTAICSAAALLAPTAFADPLVLPAGTLPDGTKVTTAVPSGATAPTFTTDTSNASAPKLTVGIGSSRTIITWDNGFNVGQGATVAFSGMNTGDIAVNRATSKMVIEGSITGGGALWFLSPGGVFVNGGTITAGGGVLMSNGSLDDSAFLGSGTLTSALAAIQSSAALIDMGGVAPAVRAEVTASGDVLLSSTAPLDINSAVASADGGSVTLSSTGAVTAGTLSAKAGDVSVQGSSIQVASVTADTGAVTLDGPVNVAAGGTLVTAGGDVSLTGAVDGPGALTIDSPGQTTIGGDVGASAALSALTVTGPLTFQGPSIKTTSDISFGALTLDATGAVTIASGGGFTAQTIDAAVSAAPVLSVTSAGDLSLGDVGQTAALASATFKATGAGSKILLGGSVAVDDAVTFASAMRLGSSGTHRVTGASASFGAFDMPADSTLSVAVSGDASFGGVLNGAGASGTSLAVQAGTASFVAGNRVGTLAASITGGGLSFSNADGLQIGTADGLSGVTASNGVSISAGGPLGVASGVTAGGAISLSAAGALSISDEVSSTSGGAINLAASGDVAESGAGKLSGGTLTISTGGLGDIRLAGANAFDRLGATSASGGAVEIVDTKLLTVDGPVTAQSLRLVATGLTFGSLSAAGGVTLDATSGALTGTSATAAGSTADLSLSGASVALSGAAQAGRDLTVTATGTASLGSAAAGRDYSITAQDFAGGALAPLSLGRDVTIVDTAGGLELGGLTAPRSLSVVTQGGGALVVSGALSATSGDIVLATQGGGALTLGANLSTGASGAVALNATGAVNQTGGLIQTGTVGGTSAGGFSLDGLNSFATLGAVSNTGAGGITINDALALAISAPLAGGTGPVSVTAASINFGDLSSTTALTLTGASGGVTGNTVTAASGDLTLKGAGAVFVSGLVKAQAGAVHATATGAALQLGAVSAGSGGAALDGDSVQVAGAIQVAGGGVRATAAAGSVAVAGINAGGGDISLSGGSVSASGPILASDGGVAATSSAGDLTLGAVTASKDIRLESQDLGSAAAGDGGSIRTGVLTAGSDVGIASADGGVTSADISAGDDIVVRALYGRVTVDGDMKSGRNMAGVVNADGAGAADDIAASSKFPDFDLSVPTDFVLKGHDVEISAQAIKVTGAIVAGVQQPGGDNPDAAALLDTTPSDVRLHSGFQTTPTTGLPASILVGDITATRDIQIDSLRGVETGALKAGQDVAVLARGLDSSVETDPLSHGLGVTVGSATAGRYVVMYGVWGRTHALGDVEAHHSFPNLQPDSTGDTSDGAGERLAAYIRYLDLDDASRPFIAGGGDVLIKGAGVDLDGAVRAGGAVRVASTADLHIGGSVTALVGDIRLEAAASDAGSLAAITTGGLTAGGDVAVWSRNGSASLGALTAGDDVAIRAQGAVATGSLSAGAGHDTGASGGADQLTLASKGGALALEGQAFGVSGLGDIDIKGPAITIGGPASAAGSVRLQTPGSLTTGDISAVAGDVLADAGPAATLGRLAAGRDVGVRATGAGANVTLAGASAGDDVVLRGGVVRVNGDLASGSGPNATAADQAGDLIAGADAITVQGFTYGLSGGAIDIKSGDVTVNGAATAAGDARFQSSGALATGDVTTASGDVLADAGGAITMNRLTAHRDVGVRSTGAGVTLGGATAGGDLVLRAKAGVSVSGALAAGSSAGSSAADQAGDLIAGADALTVQGRAFGLSGRDLDVKAADVAVIGASTAAGNARFQSTGALVTGDVSATGGDVLADATGAVTMGRLVASRDVGVRSTGGGVTLGGATAGDDVVLRAKTGVSVGALAAGSSADSSAADQAGDLIAGADALTLLGRAFPLGGGDIDVKAATVAVSGTSTAGGDARFQSPGALVTGDVSARGGDVLADATGAVTMGRLVASRDVGVRSTGGGVTLGGATAGDDVVLRAKTGVSVGGALAAGSSADSSAADQAGDLIAGADVLTVLGRAFGLSGGDIDVKAASVTVTGASTAGGDARFQSTGALATGEVSAVGGDVLADATGAVTMGRLVASRDVGVRSTDGGVTLGGATAGDDVVLRARTGVTASGALAAGVSAESSAADQAGDLIAGADALTLLGRAFGLSGGDIDVKSASIAVTGASTAGGDARFQSTGALVTGDVSAAGGDVLADATGAITMGRLVASRDVGVRSTGAGVTLGGATAGDDVMLRAKTGVSVSGALAAGASADSSAADQAGDLIAGADALTLQGRAFGLSGGDIDVKSASIAVTGALTARGDARFQSTGALATGDVSAAGGDVLADATGAITMGRLVASRDVGVRSTGAGVTLGGATAGDDVVLRAKGDIKIAATVTAGANGGVDVTAGDQAGELIADADRFDFGGVFSLTGRNVDIKTAGALTAGAGFAATDFRAQAGEVKTGDLEAGHDLLLDGRASVTAGRLKADGDVAIYARAGAAQVGGATAGDDIVVRAANGLSAGALVTRGQGAGVVGDRLADLAGTIKVEGQGFLLGGDIDLRAAEIKLSEDATASRDLRLQTAGAVTTLGLKAGRDVLVDAEGDISLGAASAARDIGVRSTRAGVKVGQTTAGDDLVLRAAGALQVAGPLAARGGPDESGAADLLFAAEKTSLAGDFGLTGANIDLRSGGDIDASGQASADQDVRAQTTASGQIRMATVSAGGDILLDGAGAQAVRADGLTAGGDIAVRGRNGGSVSIGQATAGDDIALRTTGTLEAGALTAGGGADAAGAGDRLLGADGQTFDLAGATVDVKADSIRISGDVGAGGDIHVQTSGALALAGLTAGRDVLADASGAVTAGAVSAGRDVAIRSGNGNISLAQAAAGDDIVLRGPGEVRVSGTLASGGGSDGQGSADALFAADRSGLSGDVDLVGATIDVKAGRTIAVGGATSAAGDARFQTSGDGSVQVAAISAGRDLLLDGSSVSGGEIVASAGDVAVRSRSGGIALGSAAAGDDIALRAAKDVQVTGGLKSGSGANSEGAADRLIAAAGAIRWAPDASAPNAVSAFDTADGAIDVRGAGAITVGGAVQSSSSARFETPGQLDLNGVSADKLVFVRASNLSIVGDWAAPTIRIEATAAGGLALGDGVSGPAGALTLSQAQFDRLRADAVQIFVGDTSGAARGASLTIGRLAVDVSRVRGSLELYAGGSTDVRILGAVAPTTEGAHATRFQIGAADATIGDWTPRTIQVVADNGGAIGRSTTSSGLAFSGIRAFGEVQLNARDSILMGYQSFIDKLATADPGDVPALVKTLTAPQGPNGPVILLTGGAVTLRADRIAQQDTSSLGSQTGAGLYVNGQLLLGRTLRGAGGAPTPELIELSGAIANGSSVLTGQGASLSNLIALDDGVRPSQAYRLNGCVILQQGNCTAQGGTPNLGLAPERFTVLQLLESQGAGVSEDPTVASATNEEIWRDPD